MGTGQSADGPWDVLGGLIRVIGDGRLCVLLWGHGMSGHSQEPGVPWQGFLRGHSPAGSLCGPGGIRLPTGSTFQGGGYAEPALQAERGAGDQKTWGSAWLPPFTAGPGPRPLTQ